VSGVLGYYPMIYFYLTIMTILKLIIKLLNLFSFSSINITRWLTNDLPKEFPTNLRSETVSDIFDCAKAHEQIEKRDAKKITLFVSYKEYVNEKNGIKTTAG
jgi:hypothetical protein